MSGVVIPSFVVAPLLVLIFVITLKWLPGSGWNDGAPHNNIILPMVALSLAYIASLARITRGSMIEVLNANFTRTARQRATDVGHHFLPRVECYRYCLIWAGVCRHHHRLNGDRNHLRSAGHRPVVC